MTDEEKIMQLLDESMPVRQAPFTVDGAAVRAAAGKKARIRVAYVKKAVAVASAAAVLVFGVRVGTLALGQKKEMIAPEMMTDSSYAAESAESGQKYAVRDEQETGDTDDLPEDQNSTGVTENSAVPGEDSNIVPEQDLADLSFEAGDITVEIDGVRYRGVSGTEKEYAVTIVKTVLDGRAGEERLGKKQLTGPTAPEKIRIPEDAPEGLEVWRGNVEEGYAAYYILYESAGVRYYAELCPEN